MNALRRAARLVPLALSAPIAVASAGEGTAASRNASSPIDPEASHLRQAALRARAVLTEPPQILSRCARAEWRRHAGPDVICELSKCQSVLMQALEAAAQSWKSSQRVEPDELAALSSAAGEAEEAVRRTRMAAVEGAASVPWGDAMRGARFEYADGTEADGKTCTADGLCGRIVGLYFTASWCPPCRRFSPKLVRLHEEATTRGSPPSGPSFEVVQVSWDEVGDDRRSYAREYNMKWLTLPHTKEFRALADELTLRYDVQSIPALVILEVSADGSDARVVSRDGRMDVERGNAPWLRAILR